MCFRRLELCCNAISDVVFSNDVPHHSEEKNVYICDMRTYRIKRIKIHKTVCKFVRKNIVALYEIAHTRVHSRDCTHVYEDYYTRVVYYIRAFTELKTEKCNNIRLKYAVRIELRDIIIIVVKNIIRNRLFTSCCSCRCVLYIPRYCYY